MTRSELAKIRILKAEIKAIQDELDSMPIGDTFVADTYKDYSDGYGTVKVVRGYGLSESAYKKQQALKKRLSDKLVELHDRLTAMEDWLDSLDDEEMETILRMKYQNGKKDWEIAEELGCCRTTVTMKLKKYFENNRI